MDTKRLQRFSAPGHWALDGRRGVLERNRDVGYVYAHCVVDDHSRLAYVELHATDTGQAAALTLRRAAAWMTAQGAGPTEAVMTDNAKVYGAHVFQRPPDRARRDSPPCAPPGPPATEARDHRPKRTHSHSA
jgi:hypothetical protein